jgi:hypothetical protein
MENLRFLIVRRRNAQKRGAGAFLMRLSGAVGPEASQLRFIDPERSVLLEKRVYQEIKALLDQGSLRRSSGIIAWSNVEEILRYTKEQFDDSVMIIWLSHSSDFMFEHTFSWFLGRARELLDFDQDTVSVVRKEGAEGVAIDKYTWEERTMYEVDVWGRGEATGDQTA